MSSLFQAINAISANGNKKPSKLSLRNVKLSRFSYKEIPNKTYNAFGVYKVCNEEDIELFRQTSNNQENFRHLLKTLINDEQYTLATETKIELYMLLLKYIFDKCSNILDTEICVIVSIFWDLLQYSFKKYGKQGIFDFFKKLIIRFSMDRPPKQIGILTKQTVEQITDFYIVNIYTKFEFYSYMLSNNEDVEIINKDMFEISLPHSLSLDMAVEIFPRNAKILKQYTENRKPKSELEKKIETILEFEREKLDTKLDLMFAKQDEVFNKKVEEVVLKKKK